MMTVSIISFTGNGIELSKRLAKKIEECTLFTKCSTAEKTAEVLIVKESIGDWAGKQMRNGAALVFIGACGIAVRAIAPHITDKLQDSPVLVIDEKGQHVIPILAGHVGGANALAVQLAGLLDAVPIITTATDLNQKFAVDIFAKRNHLHIVNREGIGKVSAKLLAGGAIKIAIEAGHLAEGSVLPQGVELVSYADTEEVDVLIAPSGKAALVLCPREYVIGIGCKKGKEAEKIEAFLSKTLAQTGIKPYQVGALASIDVKSQERGFVRWSEMQSVPFLTYTAQELRDVKGIFQGSEFVEKAVGVDNVCERAALRACGEGGRLILRKQTEDGMTVAIARRKWSVTFDEA